MKVLYLEDDAQDAHLVRIELGKRAPEIHLDIVSTLAEALARLERFHSDKADSPMRIAATQPIASANTEINRYDLVLTDLNLPDGSGKTLLAQIRSLRLPLPVVVLTGSGSEEIVTGVAPRGR